MDQQPSTMPSLPSSQDRIATQEVPPSVLELEPPTNGRGLPTSARSHTPAPSAPPAMSTPAQASDRPLNVSDALGYLDEVKNRFQDRPDVYNHFLDIMKDFKGQVLTTPGVIERVSMLFSGHPELISGFNTFLPPGYRIECTTGDNHRITVTTPLGTLMQNAAGSLTMQHSGLASQVPPPTRVPELPRAQDIGGDVRLPDPEPQRSAETPQQEPAPPPPLSKPSTPLPLHSRVPTPQPPLPPAKSAHPQLPQPTSQPPPPPQTHPQAAVVAPQPAHIVLPSSNPAIASLAVIGFSNSLVLSPAHALNSNSTTASAASVLGGMHRVTSNPEPSHSAHPPAAFHPSLPQALPPPVSTPVPHATTSSLPGPGFQPPPQTEFNHAIQYINRIKTRFAEEPETYKQFLEILQTYQKEQRLLHDVYAQVTQLFRGASDLIDEFKMFLPDTTADAGVTPGMLPPTNFGGTPMPGTGATVGVMGMLGQTGTPGPAPGQPMSTSQVGQSRDTEWTMEVQSVSVKGDKGTTYRRKVGGSDQNREGPPVKKRRKVPEKESRTDKERERERERDREREREREREDIPAVLNPKTAPRAKKSRHHHTKVAEPSPPPFSQYGQRPSPPAHGPHVLTHPAVHHSSLSIPQAVLAPPQSMPAPPAPPAPPEIWFDRVKRAIDDRDTWEDFLKLLSLFSTNVIEEETLLQMAGPFLGGEGSELEAQFRDILGVERLRKDNFGEMPKAAGHAHGCGHPTGMGSAYMSGPKYKYGPSYRRLPDSETTLACSGRDELCRSVLNDDWVSHPTWASEESGFVAHKKNSFEEALHKSEEERHEYHVHLEAMAHTISLLEPVAAKINDMAAEERAIFRLKPDLGGRSKSIHQKIIKRVYGRENAQEVFQGLQDNPAVAVPVVLDRLKQVDGEWRKNKREWEKVWREVDSRNFYKSLDHQGVGFKANDKKAITGKALLAEIERVKEEQDKSRAEEEDVALERGVDSPQERVKRSQVLARHQLEYDMRDEGVLQDALKLTLSFLERNDQRQSGSTVQQYNAVERRRIEVFLRHFVVHQFRLGPGFDAAFGPPIEHAEWEDLGLYIGDCDEDSSEEEEVARKSRKSGKRSGGSGSSAAISAGDLKHKLNKTRKAMEKSYGRKTRGTSKAPSNSSPSMHHSHSSSRHVSPVPRASNPGSPMVLDETAPAKDDGKGRPVDLDDDVWLRHVKFIMPEQDGDKPSSVEAPETRHPNVKHFGSFFCNNTFYTLIRLIQLLYSRLIVCKNLADKLAADSLASFLPNPVADKLGLTDTAGPMGYFANLAAADRGKSSPRNPAEHFYVHLLDLVEKVFDGEMDQAVFEENMRFMFGTRAFQVFTLDKLCAAICKQVQAVVQDGRCHELMSMLEQQRVRDADLDVSGSGVAIQDVIRYRRQAEEVVGADENLFRIDWLPANRSLRIQLLDKDDLSIDPPPPAARRDCSGAGAQQARPGPASVSSRMTLRWKQYVQSYVLRYPTEGRRLGAGRKVFLRKTLLDEDADELVDTRWMSDARGGLEVMIGPGTCKLYYASGCGEAGWRVCRGEAAGGRATEGAEGGKGKKRETPDGDGGEGEVGVRERAEARARERRRWMANFDLGLLF